MVFDFACVSFARIFFFGRLGCRYFFYNCEVSVNKVVCFLFVCMCVLFLSIQKRFEGFVLFVEMCS